MKSLSKLFLAISLLGTPAIHSVVNWNNLSDTGCGPGTTNNGIEDGVQAAPVLDEDINVSGVNALVDGVHVTSLATDIAININSDSVITGSGNRCDGVLTDPAQLYLSVAAGRTITFNVMNDLLFRGTANGANKLDLLVTITGDGTVVFNLSDNQTVSFTSLATTGGTKVLVGSDGTNEPTLRFERANNSSNNNVNVTVGEDSCVSYMSTSADGLGTIEFDPTNALVGFFNLNIQDGSCFLISSHFVSTLDDPTLMDIDFASFLGEAIFTTLNGTPGAACSILRIINSNARCPELNIQPFCENILSGTTQSGFVFGPMAMMNVADSGYIDYIGTTTNTCCSFFVTDECGVQKLERRTRNGSAFIVDGLTDCTTTVTINFLGESALYFRSGVDKCGNVAPDFLITPSLESDCAGNIVFDIEGQLDVIGTRDGSGDLRSGLNVLSLEVTPTGCPVLVERTNLCFPKRTFRRNANGQYLQYNSAAFLVNNRLNIIDSVLIHTDENHDVFPSGNRGDSLLSSAPTYIGGDTYILCDRPEIGRPVIKFNDSQFRVHTDVASTGVDFQVGYTPGGNSSQFIFYNNGRCIDSGYGRNWILGTDPCFDGCCITTTDQDTHLNIFQDQGGDGSAITLRLQTGLNTNCITEGIPANTALIAEQCAVQTLFLNNASNITVGTLGTVGQNQCTGNFVVNSESNLFIDGSCFSFETHGGTIALPQAGGTTGEGAMFVDTMGTVQVLNNNITNFGMMVVKSGDAVVDLPKRNVFFDARVGITVWQPNLQNADELVIISAGETFSDFSLDWGNITQDYCCTNDITLTCFVPYEVKRTPTTCECPPVTFQNLTNIPIVAGEVDQLQILRSRICDQVHLKVSGGLVRELIFLTGLNSAEAPVGFIVVENNGQVGLNTAHTTVDSLDAAIKLGVNGVMLVANGDGTFELNEDVVIDNVCHILSGTAFGATGENRLRIVSTKPTELRIKSTGSLDLTQFNTSNKVLEIGGQTKLIAEPGARIILNGGILLFTDEAQFELERILDPNDLSAATPSGLDDVRVKMSGTGTVLMTENSKMWVPQQSFFGIETYPQCSSITSITWILQDQSSVHVGTEQSPGGAFQIGDTENQAGSVDFTLVLDGRGSTFQVDRQGFLGLGVGMVDKTSSIPNNWLVANLNNVNSISLSILEGTLIHDQIRTGDDSLASLLAIGNTVGSYSFTFALAPSVILGGGNMVRVLAGALVPVNPTVQTIANSTDTIQRSIMAGKLLLVDPTKGTQPVGVSAATLFTYLQTDPFMVPQDPRANATSDLTNILRLGLVRNSLTIQRFDLNQGGLMGLSGWTRSFQPTLEVGAAGYTIDDNAEDVVLVSEIIGAGVQ